MNMTRMTRGVPGQICNSKYYVQSDYNIIESLAETNDIYVMNIIVDQIKKLANNLSTTNSDCKLFSIKYTKKCFVIRKIVQENAWQNDDQTGTHNNIVDEKYVNFSVPIIYLHPQIFSKLEKSPKVFSEKYNTTIPEIFIDDIVSLQNTFRDETDNLLAKLTVKQKKIVWEQLNGCIVPPDYSTVLVNANKSIKNDIISCLYDKIKITSNTFNIKLPSIDKCLESASRLSTLLEISSSFYTIPSIQLKQIDPPEGITYENIYDISEIKTTPQITFNNKLYREFFIKSLKQALNISPRLRDCVLKKSNSKSTDDGNIVSDKESSLSPYINDYTILSEDITKESLTIFEQHFTSMLIETLIQHIYEKKAKPYEDIPEYTKKESLNNKKISISKNLFTINGKCLPESLLNDLTNRLCTILLTRIPESKILKSHDSHTNIIEGVFKVKFDSESFMNAYYKAWKWYSEDYKNPTKEDKILFSQAFFTSYKREFGTIVKNSINTIGSEEFKAHKYIILNYLETVISKKLNKKIKVPENLRYYDEKDIANLLQKYIKEEVEKKSKEKKTVYKYLTPKDIEEILFDYNRLYSMQFLGSIDNIIERSNNATSNLENINMQNESNQEMDNESDSWDEKNMFIPNDNSTEDSFVSLTNNENITFDQQAREYSFNYLSNLLSSKETDNPARVDLSDAEKLYICFRITLYFFTLVYKKQNTVFTDKLCSNFIVKNFWSYLKKHVKANINDQKICTGKDVYAYCQLELENIENAVKNIINKDFAHYKTKGNDLEATLTEIFKDDAVKNFAKYLNDNQFGTIAYGFAIHKEKTYKTVLRKIIISQKVNFASLYLHNYLDAMLIERCTEELYWSLFKKLPANTKKLIIRNSDGELTYEKSPTVTTVQTQISTATKPLIKILTFIKTKMRED